MMPVQTMLCFQCPSVRIQSVQVIRSDDQIGLFGTFIADCACMPVALSTSAVISLQSVPAGETSIRGHFCRTHLFSLFSHCVLVDGHVTWVSHRYCDREQCLGTSKNVATDYLYVQVYCASKNACTLYPSAQLHGMYPLALHLCRRCIICQGKVKLGFACLHSQWWVQLEK